MKKVWAIRKDASAVSPVIATILMVAITVVLAAVLYVMVLGFGTGGGSTPSLQITRTTATGGWTFSCTSPTATVNWDDVTIILQYVGGGTSVQWANITTAGLTGSGVTVENMGDATKTLDGSAKYLNVTDLGGNGQINNGDSFVITTGGTGVWTAGHTFKVTLLYEPDDGKMVDLQWTA